MTWKRQLVPPGVTLPLDWNPAWVTYPGAAGQ